MPPNDAPTPVRFREVVIVGGGCYGTFYLGQLARAAARGRFVADRVILVDRDPQCRASRDRSLVPPFGLVIEEWGAFFDRWLDTAAPDSGEPDDAIVPSPLMPHLMAEWLIRLAPRLRLGVSVSPVPVDRPVGTPYDVLARNGNRYVSFAEWTCPTHCIEPAVCPATRGLRDWEMSEAIAGFVRRAGDPALRGPALFTTRHRVFGVGMFDVADARRARRLLEEAAVAETPTRLLVGTVSSCHGATTMLAITPR